MSTVLLNWNPNQYILIIQSFWVWDIVIVKSIIFICHIEAVPHEDQSKYRQNVKPNIVLNMKNRLIHHAVVQICSLQSLSWLNTLQQVHRIVSCVLNQDIAENNRLKLKPWVLTVVVILPVLFSLPPFRKSTTSTFWLWTPLLPHQEPLPHLREYSLQSCAPLTLNRENQPV